MTEDNSHLDNVSFDDVQFIDVASESAAESTSVESTTGGGNLVAVVAAVVLGAVGIAALAGSGSEDVVPPTTTPSTTAPTPPTTAPDAETGPSPILGEGPALNWQHVEQDIDATSFDWVDGNFFATGGSSDIIIRPTTSGASVSFFGTGDASSARTIVSSTEVFSSAPDNPNELFFPNRSRLESIEIEPVLYPPTDVVHPSTIIQVQRLNDFVLVLQTTASALDVDSFRTNVATEIDPILNISLNQTEIIIEGNEQLDVIPLAETDLSSADLEALRALGSPTQVLSVGEIGSRAEMVTSPIGQIDWIAVVDDEFVVGGNELWRSSNGSDWEQADEDTPEFGGLHRPGPDGVLTGLAFEREDGFVTLSTNTGRSWRRVTRPFEHTWAIDSSSPVLAVTGWQEEPFVPRSSDWVVLTPSFELRVGGTEEFFELLDRDGNVLLSGAPADPATGFRFVPGSLDVWFVDPQSGEEIARFPQTLFASAFAASRTLDGQPQLIGFADVSNPANPSPEWSVKPVTEVFGSDALAVDITPGDGWFLADVTTATGRELYIAETPEEQPPSSSHPTHGDIAREQGDEAGSGG